MTNTVRNTFFDICRYALKVHVLKLIVSQKTLLFNLFESNP